MENELIFLAVLLCAYILLFSFIPKIETEGKDPYAVLYNQDSKNSNGKIVANTGASAKTSYTVKRSTLWGRIETSPDNVAYFFDAVLLPRKVFGFDFHQVHQWFFRIWLGLCVLVGINIFLEVRN